MKRVFIIHAKCADCWSMGGTQHIFLGVKLRVLAIRESKTPRHTHVLRVAHDMSRVRIRKGESAKLKAILPQMLRSSTQGFGPRPAIT